MSKDLFQAFGIADMPKLITDALGGSAAVLPATLHSVTAGSRGGDPTVAPPDVTVNYPCRGFIDLQDDRFNAGGLVDGGQKVIVLLGSTINNGDTAPKPGDRITIEGTLYHIPDDGTIDRDPASATYTMKVREV